MNAHESKEHIAMIRESQLASGQICAGATALGKADHAYTAYYHQAFFGLSIGIERLCKQIIIADHRIHHGAYPDDKVVTKYRHNLVKLTAACDNIGNRLDMGREYATRPDTPIHVSIIEVLSEFSNNSRYYNLDFLSGSDRTTSDPITRWWREVGMPICELHYTKKARQRDESDAAITEQMMGSMAYVMHTAETGEHIGDIDTFVRRAGSRDIVQKFGRLYSLQLVRWLASMAYELSHTGGYVHRIAGLADFHEPYIVFLNDDGMFRDRKTFKPL